MIYEIGTPDHYDNEDCDTDCTIWIEVPDNYKLKLSPAADKRIYIAPVQAKFAQGDIIVKEKESHDE
jgi:hypothetical protein